jgi:hypothetical protein
VSARSGGFAEAIDDGGAETGRGRRLGDDEIEVEGIEAAHGGE